MKAVSMGSLRWLIEKEKKICYIKSNPKKNPPNYRDRKQISGFLELGVGMRSDYKLAQGNMEVFDIYFTIGGFYEIFVTSHKVFLKPPVHTHKTLFLS